MGLRHWLDARRHGDGQWGALLHPYQGRELVSLDLETTGLDPRTDHILSIAAVPVVDGRVGIARGFSCTVRAERAFGIDSIRHHRITPDESADGASVTAAVERLLRWLGNRPLLGYNLAFDVAMLAPHVRRIAGFSLPNRRIELAGEYFARERRHRADAAIDLRLEAICADLGVPLLERHTALGDAVTVGLCWLALAQRHRR
ncbi:MAG: 3'-5' exonuclease [Pseudoxanthomonas suwonensis]|nr:3'-5' exonuclease [Pseudoxanthomonas suwonensis]